MVRLPMLYGKLLAEILDARDVREEALYGAFDAARGGVVFASTSIPGPDKCPEGTETLFQWLLSSIRITLGPVEWYTPVTYDALGPYAVFATPLPLEETKYACVEIEESHPTARLIDLDVYGADGNRVGRADLNMAPRRCLLCEDVASNCMRARRHDQESLNHYVSLLLKRFTDSPTFESAG